MKLQSAVWLCALIAVIDSVTPTTTSAAEPAVDEAARALRKAVEFFRQEVSASGGYLWRYSGDLARREGEDQASKTTAWVQPPGTPTVGGAYLLAYEALGDSKLSFLCRSAYVLGTVHYVALVLMFTWPFVVLIAR